MGVHASVLISDNRMVFMAIWIESYTENELFTSCGDGHYHISYIQHDLSFYLSFFYEVCSFPNDFCTLTFVAL